VEWNSPQLFDFWLKEVPQFVSPKSCKAIRLVCRQWARETMLPEVQIRPLIWRDKNQWPRVFQVASSLKICRVSTTQPYLVDFLRSWSAVHPSESKVETLNISDTQIDEDMTSALVACLKRHSRLRSVLLERNAWTPDSMPERISEALASMPHLAQMTTDAVSSKFVDGIVASSRNALPPLISV
jgi:hypothetical protein